MRLNKIKIKHNLFLLAIIITLDYSNSVQANSPDMFFVKSMVDPGRIKPAQLEPEFLLLKPHIEIKPDAKNGYISEICIEGDVGKARFIIENYAAKIQKMRPIDLQVLEHYLLLLNDIPGIKVTAVLSPLPFTPKAVKLTFIVKQKKVQAIIDVGNRNSRYLGPYVSVISASLYDYILAADSLSLQTIDTPTSDELRYLVLDYGLPFGLTSLRMKTSGSLAEVKPGFMLNNLNLIGRAKKWSAGLEYLLLRDYSSRLLLTGKFDWLDSYMIGNKSRTFQDHIRSIRLGLIYDFNDKLNGSNNISAEFSKGVPAFGASPLHPDTKLSRFEGSSNYKKLNISISRNQPLKGNFEALFSAIGQYAFQEDLLSSEEFSFGGTQFGRAYDPSEIEGDAGMAYKLELRFNKYPTSKIIKKYQFYGFYEIGVVWDALGEQFKPERYSACDVGIGLRANFSKYFSGVLELDKPLTMPVEAQEVVGRYGKPLRLRFNLRVSL